MHTKFGPVICPVCMGHVYFAEEVRAMGKSFHRTCFKCNVCNKLLDSFTANEHDGGLYCRFCYSKNFGVKGYRSGSNSVSQNSSLERRSRSQPRTRRLSPERSAYNSTAYVTSDYTENGYHSPNSPCSREQQFSGWDDSMAHGYRSARPRWVSSHGGAVRCANCPDLVFANERVDAVGKAFHRLCFKCASCRRLLDRGTACDHKREVFCQNCYTKHFGSTGLKAGTNLRCE
ncbi:hypothetical protein EG68_06832 [Paragonimus skrjabini miyazakii]|uniref:LIM zinc-binding domain-containing protein n=1 Tax=Paragonimus skrjabini miyazakii TaxID=59628 RepID=A0A8S9YT46_9TREM|nr:hypothetical protein EG68_06832 [Paragonimus skrjabini miyazakii]